MYRYFIIKKHHSNICFVLVIFTFVISLLKSFILAIQSYTYINKHDHFMMNYVNLYNKSIANANLSNNSSFYFSFNSIQSESQLVNIINNLLSYTIYCMLLFILPFYYFYYEDRINEDLSININENRSSNNNKSICSSLCNGFKYTVRSLNYN